MGHSSSAAVRAQDRTRPVDDPAASAFTDVGARTRRFLMKARVYRMGMVLAVVAAAIEALGAPSKFS
jgi:hypothetical protein